MKKTQVPNFHISVDSDLYAIISKGCKKLNKSYSSAIADCLIRAWPSYYKEETEKQKALKELIG